MADATGQPRQTYHHGSLREALLSAAVAIVEEQGVENLSVRELAKRAGVSPGAPFRHFASRAVLLTAVADQATERLAGHIAQKLADAAGQPPLVRVAAMGHAYLDWACAYPTHFRVVSDRLVLKAGVSPTMNEINEILREQLHALITEAFGPQADATECARAVVSVRALVYGLARMASDGHFPEWHLPHGDTHAALHESFDFYMVTLTRSVAISRGEVPPV